MRQWQVFYRFPEGRIPLPEAASRCLEKAESLMADGCIEEAHWWATSLACDMRHQPELRGDHLARWKILAAELERRVPQASFYLGGGLLDRYRDLEVAA